MNRLVMISALKTDYWQELAKKERIKPKLRYDPELDTLFVYFSPKETDRIITHSVDDNVAFLYRYSDKEVVGMKIVEWERNFLPHIPGTKKVWKLSEAGVSLTGMCDFIVAVERAEFQRPVPQRIEREVNALEPVFA